MFSAAGLKAVATPASGSDTPPDEAKPKTDLCPQCAKPFSRLDDIRTINPTPEEQERMRERMLLAKASSKTKKRKAGGDDDVPRLKKVKATDVPSAAVMPMMNPSVSSVARKVTEEIAEEEKKRKANMSSAVASLYAPKDGSGKKVKEKFLTMGTFTRVSPNLFASDKSMLTDASYSMLRFIVVGFRCDLYSTSTSK